MAKKKDILPEVVAESENDTDITIYTDGACKPNPGDSASSVAINIRINSVFKNSYNEQ